jgi:UPF0755 protein
VSKTKKSVKKRKNLPGQYSVMRRRFSVLLGGLLFILVGLWVWLNIPIERRAQKLDVHVSAGQTAKGIAEELRSQGLMVNTPLFVALVRVQGVSGKLKAGRYEIPEDIDTLGLAEFLSKGLGVLSNIALVEGFTAKDMLAKLRKQKDLVDDLQGMDQAAIARRLGLEGNTLEGWIYPDTYRYSPGSKLSEFLIRACNLQKQALAEAWSQRDPHLPLKTPYEALILASIVEKETGRPQDRPKVASVFVNRLKVGMMLQTDPTVIYGVGAAFDGNLTKKHLQTDTPYNTYTRTGLPPTPIAIPSKAALFAAVRPEETQYYYFVAKGDGSSYFSKNLSEHNNAVRKFILRR